MQYGGCVKAEVSIVRVVFFYFILVQYVSFQVLVHFSFEVHLQGMLGFEQLGFTTGLNK